jgi:peroxiredoxin
VVGSFRLSDPRDQASVGLDDLKSKKAVVVVFLGTECPVGNKFLPTLAGLHGEYADKGVQFLVVNSNVQDTPERVAAHARKYEVPFPVLKDPENKVADQFGATRISEAFVLDGRGTILYHGRIDDQFAVGVQRDKPTRRDLAEALDAVLAGKSVPNPTTETSGCVLSRVKQPASGGDVTYSKQVSRVIQNHCQECHRPGQIGPFPLMDYDDALAMSDTIREVVKDGRMPPWHADPRYGKFHNDRRLPEADKQTLLTWIDQNCPRGDPNDLPPKKDWPDGWRVGTPDAVFTMQQTFTVPAEQAGGVEYQYFAVPTNFKEDKWVVAAEAKPGAPEVVHHILVFVSSPEKPFQPSQPGNEVLCGVAPGDIALKLPPGMAKRVPAGSQLVFQMHYTTNGKVTKDRSSVGLIFTNEPPQYEAHTVSIYNAGFRIPAGADNHLVEVPSPSGQRQQAVLAAQSLSSLAPGNLAAGLTQADTVRQAQYAAFMEGPFTFEEDGYILGFMPHMHLRGKDFLYEAVKPDGKAEVLLSVPRFDFGWQTSYRLAEPYRMAKGGRVHCVAHFDNSAKNPANPDPTKEVRWGDQTWEEMMIGWMEYAHARKPDRKND